MGNPVTPSTRPSPLALPSAAAASIRPSASADPSPGGQRQRVILTGAVARGRGDRVRLFDKRCRRGEFAGQHVHPGPEDERRWKHGQCAGLTGLPHHDGGQLMPDLVVPQLAAADSCTIGKPSDIEPGPGRRSAVACSHMSSNAVRSARQPALAPPVIRSPCRSAGSRSAGEASVPGRPRRAPPRPPGQGVGSPSRPAYMAAASASR